MSLTDRILLTLHADVHKFLHLLPPTIAAFWFLNAWRVFQRTPVAVSITLPYQSGRDQLKIIWVATHWRDLCLHSWYELAYSPVSNTSKFTVNEGILMFIWVDRFGGSPAVLLDCFAFCQTVCECVFCSMGRTNRWNQTDRCMSEWMLFISWDAAWVNSLATARPEVSL